MYKVFIDNKVILFSSKFKKSSKTADSVIVNVSKSSEIDLVKCRVELAADILLIALDDDPERCMYRTFRHFELVEAAGGIVKRKNKALFIERLGKWDLPKGKMEENELPEETAVREVEEECGISGVRIKRPLCTTYHTYEYHGKPTLKKTYWFSMTYKGKEKLVPQTEEDITSAVWIKEDQFGQILENTYGSIKDVLRKYSKIKM